MYCHAGYCGYFGLLGDRTINNLRVINASMRFKSTPRNGPLIDLQRLEH
jgi:hypothetical protein